MLFLMARCSACGENTDGTSGLFSQKGARWSGGAQVECWLCNEYYSAQMAVHWGLSVQGPQTLGLHIWLCPWMLSLFLHLPDCSETVQWFSSVIGLWFLFNADMWGPVVMIHFKGKSNTASYCWRFSTEIWHPEAFCSSFNFLMS